MSFLTGQTIIEDFLSLDLDNNPVTATTFDTVAIKDGAVFPGVTINTALVDASRGMYSASWSSDTSGNYQIYIKNNVTNVIFLTDSITLENGDSLSQNIYVGL